MGASLEPVDLVSVSMSPSETSEYNDDAQVPDKSHSFLQKSQIWEQFVSDNVKHEVDLLKSRTTIAETLLAEKTKQLDIVNKQVQMLKERLLSADQLNKEQAIMIESLKRRLSASSNGNSNGSNDVKMMFENGGGVTITPVVTSSSVSNMSAAPSAVNKSQNLLSHLLLRDSNGKSADIATIEPVRGKS